jgi:hypothetical protein
MFYSNLLKLFQPDFLVWKTGMMITAAALGVAGWTMDLHSLALPTPHTHKKHLANVVITPLLDFDKISRERKKNGSIFPHGYHLFLSVDEMLFFFFFSSKTEVKTGAPAVTSAGPNDIFLQVLLCVFPTGVSRCTSLSVWFMRPSF